MEDQLFGISNAYTIKLVFLGYSQDSQIIKFRIETEPKISIIVREVIEEKLHDSYPFLNLRGDIVKVHLKDIGVRNILEDIQVKDDKITIKVKWR